MVGGYFPTVTHAPCISHLKVVTYWKRLPSQEIWFRVQVTPLASNETAARGSRVWVDPKKDMVDPATVHLDTVYYIQRTFTHFLHFYRQFGEEFADRLDLLKSLPRLADRRSMLHSKDKDAQRKSELLDDLFTRLLQWPQQVSESRTVGEFFGVWYCDVDSLTNNSHIPTPEKGPNFAMGPMPMPFVMQTDGPRSSLKSIPYLHPTKSQPIIQHSASLRRPGRASPDAALVPQAMVSVQPASPSPRRSRSLPHRSAITRQVRSNSNESSTDDDAANHETDARPSVPAPSRTLKASKSFRGLRRLASTTLARKFTQTFNSPPSEPEAPTLPAPIPTDRSVPFADTPAQPMDPNLASVVYLDAKPLPRLPSMLVTQHVSDMQELTQELNEIRMPSMVVAPEEPPSPVARVVSPPPAEEPIMRGRLANMVRRSHTTGSVAHALGRSRKPLRVLTPSRPQSPGSDGGNPPTPPPPLSLLRRTKTTIGRLVSSPPRSRSPPVGAAATTFDGRVPLSRSVSTSDRSNNTIQLKFYLNGTILMTIPLLRAELTKPASPRARQAARSTSMEFSRIYTSILRHLHALGGDRAGKASQLIQSFVLVYHTPSARRCVARTEEEIVHAVHNGPRNISCHVVEGDNFQLESVLGEEAEPALPTVVSEPIPAATVEPPPELCRSSSEPRIVPARPPRRDLQILARRVASQRQAKPHPIMSVTLRSAPNPKHLVRQRQEQRRAEASGTDVAAPIPAPEIKDLINGAHALPPPRFPSSTEVTTPTFGVSTEVTTSSHASLSSESDADPPSDSEALAHHSFGRISMVPGIVRGKRPATLIRSASTSTLRSQRDGAMAILDSPAAPQPPATFHVKAPAESTATALSPVSPPNRVSETTSLLPPPPSAATAAAMPGPLRRHPTLSKSMFIMHQRHLNRMHHSTDAPQADHNVKNRLINANTLHIKVVLNHETKILLAVPRTAVYSVLWDKVVTKFAKARALPLAKLKTMTLTYVWEDRFEIIDSNASWREALRLVDEFQSKTPGPISPPTPAMEPQPLQLTRPTPVVTKRESLTRSASALFSRRRRASIEQSVTPLARHGTLSTRPSLLPKPRLDMSQFRTFIAAGRHRNPSAVSPLNPAAADQGLANVSTLSPDGSPAGCESVGKLVLYLVPTEMFEQNRRNAMLMTIPTQLVDSAIQSSSLASTPMERLASDPSAPSSLVASITDGHRAVDPADGAVAAPGSYFPATVQPSPSMTGIPTF
ncbi:hypothetical protein IWQ60_008113 [Tieghemiomyces parasiticus]|uniref:PX domain-containing protein n=1 Tax=Tieghemiomyces parasiticus TaxID=78921 RepID=A0A9W8DSE6_9FUNG|nr:hypothetical protein IWQ60_008113 [Tieghemiomyces parasiticus]